MPFFDGSLLTLSFLLLIFLMNEKGSRQMAVDGKCHRNRALIKRLVEFSKKQALHPPPKDKAILGRPSARKPEILEYFITILPSSFLFIHKKVYFDLVS